MKIRSCSGFLSFPHRLSKISVAITGVISLLCVSASNAQTIIVPNGSFESPSTTFVTNNFDSWQKTDRPAYFDYVEQNYGYSWNQMSGAFAGTGTYGNLHGSQAAYLFSFPQVGLVQDFDTMDYNDASPSHAFNAAFEVGKSYSLTLGVFGKGFYGAMTEGSMFGLSLYYRDGLNMVTVGTPTIVTYTAAGFPNFGGTLNLQDVQVNIPTVQAGDAWAGQHIGIKIESIYGTGDGYWDFDNVRLTAVPETGSLGLIAVGGLLFALRSRNRP